MISPKAQLQVSRSAAELFDRRPDWVTFYREMLGLRGVVRRAFPTREILAAFEQTDAYREIMNMLTKLREQGVAPDAEETRVITVRLPKSMHEALRVEAHEHCTSMNKLCISKLLQFVDSDQVPSGETAWLAPPTETIVPPVSAAKDNSEGHDQPGRFNTE